MRNKIILYIATSLDGFIARKNGGIDWISPFENKQEDYGYKEFYRGIGTVIVGNRTYKQALTFDEFPFKGVDCFVFTKDKNMLKDEHATFVSIGVKDFIGQLKPKNNKNIWLVGGASIIAEFLKYDLIDEFIITIVPILLGEGIPLFKEKINEKSLKLIDVKSFDSGLVQLYYVRRE